MGKFTATPTKPQGKSVLTRLPESRGEFGARVLGHGQVIEDQSDVAGEALDGRSDAVFGLGFDDADGETTQGGEVFRAVTFAEGAAILIPVPVEDVVAAVLDGPVAAVETQEP